MNQINRTEKNICHSCQLLLLLAMLLCISCKRSSNEIKLNGNRLHSAHSTIMCCETNDTLLEIVEKGTSLMKTIYGDNAVESIDTLVSMIDYASKKLKMTNTSPDDTAIIQ